MSWARSQFEELFNHTPRRLLHAFPADMVTAEGVPFWSGHKRPPKPLVFDATDPLHVLFVRSAAHIRAQMFGLHSEQGEVVSRGIVNAVIKAFDPADGPKIVLGDAKASASAAPAPTSTASDVDVQCAAVVCQLPLRSSLAGFRLVAVDFDKDDDANMHMDVMMAVANLRARSYRIDEKDKQSIRKTAGKIVPAIATTTALVSGLACVELLKLLQPPRWSLSFFHNSFMNLAISYFTESEPQEPAKMGQFTVWDRIDMEGPLTLRQLIDDFAARRQLEVSMLSCGTSLLYNSFGDPAKMAQRMTMDLSDLVISVTKRPIGPHQKFVILEPSCTDADGNDVEVPSVRFRVRQRAKGERRVGCE